MDWLRLYIEARTDAKLECLTDAEHRVWFKLLCFAGEQEQQRGVIPHMHPFRLAAEVARGDQGLLKETIEKLQILDILKPRDDGSLAFINWDKRQFESDLSTERVRKHREKVRQQSGNADETFRQQHETPPDTDTDTDTESDTDPDPEEEKHTEQERKHSSQPGENEPAPVSRRSASPHERSPRNDYPEDFEAFWAVYPRRLGKSDAFKAWRARLKGKAKPEDIIQAAANYAAYCRQNATEERYIKHAATFLGPGKPFEDFVNGVPEVGKPKTRAEPRSWGALQRVANTLASGGGSLCDP